MGEIIGVGRRRTSGEVCGIASNDGFSGVAAKVENEHLEVKVFADGYFFVSSFGMGHREAICYFHLRVHIIDRK